MTQTHVEPYIGQVVGPREVTVTPQLLATYRGGLAVEPGPTVPGMLANAFETTLLFSQQRGHLWLRQEWELHRPLQPGATYTVETRVTDIYPRRDRTILLTETALRDGEGALVSLQRHHQSFLLDNPPAGEVTLRDPAAKEGARRELPAMVRELASLERTVTLEMCGEFFYGSKNYHSDRKQSEALGFRDVVVGGRMTMGYIGELLDTSLGERWARTGRLLVKFTNVLWPEEAIRATVGLGEPGDDPSRETVLGRVEKADGTVVIVAEGSVARA
jgi:acyl dehydratase